MESLKITVAGGFVIKSPWDLWGEGVEKRSFYPDVHSFLVSSRRKETKGKFILKDQGEVGVASPASPSLHAQFLST